MPYIEPAFIGPYRDYDIFSKPDENKPDRPGSVSFLAYKRGSITVAARSSTLANVMGVIDVLISEEQRHMEV